MTIAAVACFFRWSEEAWSSKQVSARAAAVIIIASSIVFPPACHSTKGDSLEPG